MNAPPPQADASRTTNPPGAAWDPGTSERRQRRVHRAWAWFARRWSDALFVVLAAGLFGWISWEAWTLRLITFYPTTDYWEHSATLRALMDDPFHPRNPHLPTTTSSPRFNPVFLLVAIVARGLNLDALQAMSLLSTLNVGLFIAGAYLFFRSYFRDPRASLYGLIVLFCSWWEGFHFANVYQIKILFSTSAYPSTSALGLTLLAFWFELKLLRASRASAFALVGLAAWTAAILITHQVTAMMALAGLGLLALTEPLVTWRRRFDVIAMVLLGCLLAELWPYFSVWEVLSGGRGTSQGWATELVSGAADEASTTRHFFYRPEAILDALGVAALGVLPLPYFLFWRRHWFILGGALAMGLPFIVNAYVPLPLGHRFLLLLVFFLQASFVWLLLLLTPGAPESSQKLRKRWFRWVPVSLVAAVLAYSIHVNVDKAARRVEQSARRAQGRESPIVRYARAVAELAGPDAVVLADPQASWPLPTFGPKVLVLEHDNPFIEDMPDRLYSVRRFFNARTPDAVREEILSRYGVTHVVVASRNGRAIEPFLRARGSQRALPAGYRLYTLRPKKAG